MTKTLCKRDQDKIEGKSGSKKARFTCQKCGRRTAKKKRLCKPIKKG